MDRPRRRAPGQIEALRRAFIENAAHGAASRVGATSSFSLAAAAAAGRVRAPGAGEDTKNKAR